ncbi:hypothetical protein BD309DRAFT_954811 [Dichomitus squalens]|nr:hypothetical protein BD309DRAFT_954811 [Dichomitus squalens]
MKSVLCSSEYKIDRLGWPARRCRRLFERTVIILLASQLLTVGFIVGAASLATSSVGRQ